MKFEKPTLKEWNAAEKLADPVAFKAWGQKAGTQEQEVFKRSCSRNEYQ